MVLSQRRNAGAMHRGYPFFLLKAAVVQMFHAIKAFFVRFEVFAAYLVICRPQSPRNKDGAPKYEPQEWVWPDQKAREERMAFYRELLDVIYRKSPERVPEWLELGKLEKINLSLASLGLASLS
jgi:hypothetical protein